MSVYTRIYSDEWQESVDESAHQAELTYEIWRDWERQHTLVEIEQRLRGEGAIRGNSHSRFVRVVLGLSIAALAVLLTKGWLW